jgi:uncharacterized protein (DUF433 family)
VTTTSESFCLGEGGLLDPGPVDLAVEGDNTFATFAAALVRELDPRSRLERVLADRVVLSAWALELIAEKELIAIGNPFPGTPCDAALKARRTRLADVDISPQRVLLVVQGLDQALAMFRRLREQAVLPEPGETSTFPMTGGTSDTGTEGDSDDDLGPDTVFDLDCELVGDELAALSNEWPVVPRGRPVEDENDPAIGAGATAPQGADQLDVRWKGRLRFDTDVSEDSPVIEGTWVTVAQVISLIVDGWTWSDILRAHPELSEDDIRVCLAFTVAEENGEL